MSYRPDVLLVRPWARSAVPSGSLVEDPLGIGYVAAALREAGFTVALLDAYTFGFDDDDLVRCIGALAPRVLGISLHSFADYRHTVAISDAVAAAHPDVFRAIGGEHATFLAREILERHPSIEAVVLGEGERTFVELVTQVITGRRRAAVAGAVTRGEDGRPVHGGFRPPVADLDQLPHPAKDLVDTAVQLGRPVAVSILTGRGCTHKCTFCTANTYLRMASGTVWRRRAPAAVASEMEELVRRYEGAPGVHPMIQFQDVIFLGTSRRAREWTATFVAELERRELRAPYYFMSRAEAILANEDLLPRLAATGLSSVEVGIESGVDRILQAYNKQNSADRTAEAIRLLQANGICYDASGFIMFDPHITLEELRINATYLHQLGHATWDRYVTKLQVFPGTAIRPQLIAEGLLRADADLDDVYAYRYENPRVGELAEHVWMYDEAVRALDTAIHNARALAGDRGMAPATKARLRAALSAAQDVYRDHFLALVELAEQNELTTRFEERMRAFLIQVELLHRMLLARIAEAAVAASTDPAFFLVPAPAPESELALA